MLDPLPTLMALHLRVVAPNFHFRLAAMGATHVFGKGIRQRQATGRHPLLTVQFSLLRHVTTLLPIAYYVLPNDYT